MISDRRWMSGFATRSEHQNMHDKPCRNGVVCGNFIHRLGEIRDRTYENQQHRASGLNLLISAIILWNTRYLSRAVAVLRETEDVPDTFSLTYRHSGGSTSISPATTSGHLPRQRKTMTASGYSGPLQIQHSLQRKFAVCPLMLQKCAFR